MASTTKNEWQFE